jgi:hypothetical protein
MMSKPIGVESDTMREVRELLQSSRALFETVLKRSLNHTKTKGTCLYASVMTAQVLNRFTDAEVTIRGGDGEDDGGIFVDGIGRGHYWMEAEVDGELYILDISADQFCLPPITIERLEVLHERYRSGCQETVDEHVAHILEDIQSEQGL